MDQEQKVVERVKMHVAMQITAHMELIVTETENGLHGRMEYDMERLPIHACSALIPSKMLSTDQVQSTARAAYVHLLRYLADTLEKETQRETIQTVASA